GGLHARANKIADELRAGIGEVMKRVGAPGTCFGESSIIHVSFEGRPGLAGFDRPRRGDLYQLLRCAVLNNRVDCAPQPGWLSARPWNEAVGRQLVVYEKALGAMVAEGCFKGM